MLFRSQKINQIRNPVLMQLQKNRPCVYPLFFQFKKYYTWFLWHCATFYRYIFTKSPKKRKIYSFRSFRFSTIGQKSSFAVSYLEGSLKIADGWYVAVSVSLIISPSSNAICASYSNNLTVIRPFGRLLSHSK